MATCMDSNDELRKAYKRLTKEVVDAINADSVVDSLFAAGVLSAADFRELGTGLERTKKTRNLLFLLHNGRHPEAFIKLHDAIKADSAYSWLADKIENLRISSKGAASASKRRGRGVKSATRATPTFQHVAISGGNHPGLVSVTSINGRLFVLRGEPNRQRIQVYNTESFEEQQTLKVGGLSNDTSASGMTYCAKNNCLYVSDPWKAMVYKIELSDNNIISWRVGRSPRGLSINSACNLIVACFDAHKIQEYDTTSGSLVREICLESNGVVLQPFHAIQLTSDQFIVSCWNETKSVSDVVEVDAKGQIVVSYMNQLKSTTQHEFNWPRHISVDKNNELIFVADTNNNRIVILNRSLKLCIDLCELNAMISVSGGLHGPCHCFDESQNRLFVGENDGQRRVMVFDDVIQLSLTVFNEHSTTPS